MYRTKYILNYIYIYIYNYIKKGLHQYRSNILLYFCNISPWWWPKRGSKVIANQQNMENLIANSSRNTYGNLNGSKIIHYRQRMSIIFNQIFSYLHLHHVVPLAWVSLTLSCHFSLSFIASGRSSGLHPVSSHSCCMHVRPGRPAFARPYVGIHRGTSLMSSVLLLQQCPACLVRLTWIVSWCEAGGRIVGALWGVATRTCSILLATFLCNCRLASSPAI